VYPFSGFGGLGEFGEGADGSDLRMYAQISSMVQAGTKHFKANLKQLDDQDTAATISKVLRLYNSGSFNEGNLSDGKGATDSYVSDIANRLQGRIY